MKHEISVDYKQLSLVPEKLTMLNLEALSVSSLSYNKAFRVWTLQKQCAGFMQLVKQITLDEGIV